MAPDDERETTQPSELPAGMAWINAANNVLIRGPALGYEPSVIDGNPVKLPKGKRRKEASDGK